MLDERFAVGAVLGRGAFGITYLAEDLVRNDQAVVNELAPAGSVREADDLEFALVGPAAAQRLRHQFTAEARKLQKFRIPRIPQFRAVFHEHQTAYIATDFIEDARPLTEAIGTVEDFLTVKRILLLLSETLEAVHSLGVLHQDVKPSNILLAPNGDPYLVDIGAARQWCADLTLAHDLQFESGFAALEQLSERGRRTPATDLYGLGATTYTLLTKSPPVPAQARLEGAPLIPLSHLRPDVPREFANAIERMLEIEPEDRPQSVADLKELLEAPKTIEAAPDRVRALDAKRRRLQLFRHDPRQCPSCGEVLTEAEPLPAKVCPVCHDGRIKTRKIEERICPSCGGGILRHIKNEAPVKFCPSCSLGDLRPKRSLFKGTTGFECAACSFALVASETGATDKTGNDRPWEEWRKKSGRQASVMTCDACLAQFDEMPDGRWQRMTENILGQEWTRLYPEEWARVAAGLAPDAGNAFCESCNADFFIAEGCITLLTDPTNDPHGFSSLYCGHLIPESEIAYLAVGKESGRKGLVCRSCMLEFDFEGSAHRLVRSSDPRLRRHINDVHTLSDWHRIAQDLPRTGEEENIREDIADALAEAFSRGELEFDSKNPDVVWRGRATQVAEDGSLSKPSWLSIDEETVVLGRHFKKRTELLRDVQAVSLDMDVLALHLLTGESWRIRVEPVDIEFSLESGKDRVVLGADALAQRLSAMTQRSGR